MTAGFRILPAPPRPSRELVAALAEMVTAHLSDNMSRLQGAAAAIRPMHAGGRLAGPALTVRVPAGDNLMVHKAIDIAAPGDVIVVDAAGMLEQAIIGDIMTSLAAKRGVAGFVIDGAIRDAQELASRPFPVYARGVTHRGPYKNGPGEINVPVSIGGMVVRPGRHHRRRRRRRGGGAAGRRGSRARRRARAEEEGRRVARRDRGRHARPQVGRRDPARQGVQVLAGASSSGCKL